MSRPFLRRRPARPAAMLWLCVSLLLAAAASATTKKPPLQPINLNAATSKELQQVPGIGPATADKILQMRKSYGPFKSVDDLLAIRGIGKKRLDKMRKYLTAGKPASPARPAATSNSARPAKCPGCAGAAPPAAKPNALNSSASAPAKNPPPSLPQVTLKTNQKNRSSRDSRAAVSSSVAHSQEWLCHRNFSANCGTGSPGRCRVAASGSRLPVWLEALVRRPWDFDAEGDLVGDADAVAFQSDNFLGVVG